MKSDYNKKYYNWIIEQIKDLKYYYGIDQLMNDLIDLSTHYSIHPINLDEFKQAYEWAIADIFGNGCEIERN